MSSLVYKDRVYGGVTTITSADRVIVDNGSGTNVTTQYMIENILGDLATVEQQSTASKAYSVDQYLIYNGFFYKVIAAIAIGDDLLVGTNIVKTDISSEMGSGSGLPPVTSSDNGKFLRVVDGEWSVVSVPAANGGQF